MASIVANAGMHKLISGVSGEIDWVNDTIKAMLLDNGYTPDKDHEFVSEISASEISATNYTGGYGGAGRKSLASKTITKDDTNDRVVFDAADPSWTSLGGATNDTVAYLAIIKEITNDAASPIIAIIEASTAQSTNGSDLTWQFSADGAFRLSL